jgi:hypothetical protein
VKAIEIAENIFEVTITHPKSGKTRNKTLLMSEEQKQLASLFPDFRTFILAIF